MQNILAGFTTSQPIADLRHIASFKDTVDPAVQKIHNEWLPNVSISPQRPIDRPDGNAGIVEPLYNPQNAARQIALELELLQLYLNGPDIPGGLESEFDQGLFRVINDWRVRHNLSELEFDPNMQKMAAANTSAMANRGRIGHWAYGGYEVAGQGYGTPEATLYAWLNSPGHYDIIANPNLKTMGPAGNPVWQTVHFS